MQISVNERQEINNNRYDFVEIVESHTIGIQNPPSCDWYKYYPFNIFFDNSRLDNSKVINNCHEACQNGEDCAKRLSSSEKSCTRKNNAEYLTIRVVPLVWWLPLRFGDFWNHFYTEYSFAMINISPFKTYEKEDETTGNELNFKPHRNFIASFQANGKYDMVSNFQKYYINHWLQRKADDLEDVQFTDKNNKIPLNGATRCYTGDYNAQFLSQCISKSQIIDLMKLDDENTASSCTSCVLGSSGCLGDPGLLDMTQAASCTLTTQGGITRQCLQNSNSISSSICNLAGDTFIPTEQLAIWNSNPTCINADFITNNIPSILEEENGKFVDPNLLVSFKLKQNILDLVEIYVYQGSKGNCNFDFISRQGQIISDTDINNEIFHIAAQTRTVHQFILNYAVKVKDGYACGNCPEGHAFDTPNIGVNWFDGIGTCTPCNQADKIRKYVKSPYSHHHYECVQCEINKAREKISTLTSTVSQHAQFNDYCSDCITATSRATPRRLASETQCTSCEVGKYFEVTYNSDEGACIEIPSWNINYGSSELECINCHLDTELYEKAFQYPRSTNNVDLINVMAGSYRDTNDQIQSCSRCKRFEYSAYCGRPFDSPLNMFAKQGLSTLVMFRTIPSADLPNYELVREGVCTSCLQCAAKEYNGHCGADINSEGYCQACLTACGENEYLSHEDKTNGCEWTKSLHDYECKPCPTAVKIDNEIMLVVGCGDNTDFKRWNLINELLTCNYNDASPSIECQYAGQSAVTQLSKPKPWGYGDLIPFCPRRYHIDKGAFELMYRLEQQQMQQEEDVFFYFSKKNPPLSNDYDASICKQCEVQKPGQLKTSTYVDCTGKSFEDTQKGGYANACDSGLYREEYTSGGFADECSKCTTCE